MMGRMQNIIFVVLLLVVIGLLGWVSKRHQTEFDLTWGNRNSLTEATVNALKPLNQTISITAFVREDNKAIHDLIKELVARYHRHKTDIELKFQNPDLVPQLVREHGITVDGEILVGYGNRQETLQNVSEKTLTQLLVKLASSDKSYITFLSGHGERDLLGIANHDLGDFAKQLENKGFLLQNINLLKNPGIPTNTRILLIASPKTPLLPGEIQMIEDYLANGGNLLWLTEPNANDGLSALAAYFDIKRLAGQVVDATTQLFGISDPTFALVIDYPAHAISEQLHSQTLFPKATGLMRTEKSDWLSTPILQTLPRSWTELGDINNSDGSIRFDQDKGERAGPITIGLALEQQVTTQGQSKPATQRAIVIGDGDFLSNTYLGNGQNLDLGSAIFQWLNHNDSFIDIGSVSAPDTQLQLSPGGAIGLLVFFLIIFPLGLLGVGTSIWIKRRRR